MRDLLTLRFWGERLQPRRRKQSTEMKDVLCMYNGATALPFSLPCNPFDAPAPSPVNASHYNVASGRLSLPGGIIPASRRVSPSPLVCTRSRRCCRRYSPSPLVCTRSRRCCSADAAGRGGRGSGMGRRAHRTCRRQRVAILWWRWKVIHGVHRRYRFCRGACTGNCGGRSQHKVGAVFVRMPLHLGIQGALLRHALDQATDASLQVRVEGQAKHSM